MIDCSKFFFPGNHPWSYSTVCANTVYYKRWIVDNIVLNTSNVIFPHSRGDNTVQCTISTYNKHFVEQKLRLLFS